MEIYGNFLMTLFLLTFLHFEILSSPVDNSQQVAQESDLYTESPCELRALSAYKDIQGNIWGVGNGNLWWFNATNLSWSLLPLPNGTAASEPWKVACGDPKKYVALVGKNASLVLHLPWQHWQFVDTDDFSLGYVDKDATWCMNGNLFGIDPLRETLYLLDSEEAHWTVSRDMPIMDNVNWSTPLGVVNTWIWDDGELVMVEKFGIYTRIMYTNASGIDWVVMASDNLTTVWPDLNQSDKGLSLSFKLGSENMWLWLDDKSLIELWTFNHNTTKWRRANRKFTSKLPSLQSVLVAWEENGQLCAVTRSSECTAQYSVSHTECWSENDMLLNDDDDNFDSALRLTTVSTTPNAKSDEGSWKSERFNTNYTSPSRVIPPPITSPELPMSSEISPIEILNPIKPIITKYSPEITWKTTDQTNKVVSITPARFPLWHQHTGVFGSVIFFGTSLTIFGLVGFFWCVRKCVHFPKEALLLRDPPSVRYTAIPDSLGYDSRKPTPATYTVIPDSLA
ncbi:uncharacterized protein [Parasteatoda tepidariorum]|uniref:uncharacterized protein n=1 Tax=Parasteatoda tepidariorum TaxID=114398 RepID=UPI00077FDF86|nr:uncharacterized protein LOC107455063 [Parasteatoda tepidariorum]